ncbi:putative C2 domain-containing protein 5 isoform X5 [Sesbania bispinosa]|nr:putative C2 domain-containing protein 5 isoform X5 [Sesbania bispinosa]
MTLPNESGGECRRTYLGKILEEGKRDWRMKLILRVEKLVALGERGARSSRVFVREEIK